MLRASGFYKSPSLSSEIPKLLLLCYLIFPIRNSRWKCKTRPKTESENFFNSIWTPRYWNNKNKTQQTQKGEKNQNLPGFNKFQYKSWTGSFWTVRGCRERTPPKSNHPECSLGKNGPVAPSSELEPEWKLVWKLVSTDEEQTAANRGREKPEGSLPRVFAIITKAKPAAGWHRAPRPSAM